MRRGLVLLAVSASLVAASCARDGRGLGSPNDNNASIIKATTTTVDSDNLGSIYDDFIDETLPTEEDAEGLDEIGGMTITMPFELDTPIPTKYTCDGQNVSPAITWADLPPGTVEVAIQVIDLEAENYIHWVITGLRPEAGSIAEGSSPMGAVQAKNSKGTIGYTGPCPPKGSTHNYLYEVAALDRHITLLNGADPNEMLEAIGEATIQSASNSGYVSR